MAPLAPKTFRLSYLSTNEVAIQISVTTSFIEFELFCLKANKFVFCFALWQTFACHDHGLPERKTRTPHRLSPTPAARKTTHILQHSFYVKLDNHKRHSTSRLHRFYLAVITNGFSSMVMGLQLDPSADRQTYLRFLRRMIFSPEWMISQI
jgi:hypothetical protein